MARIIKFRFWEKPSSTMFGAEYTDELFKNVSVLPSKIFSGEDRCIIPMQFTGLKDNHDTEIYEDDLLDIKMTAYSEVLHAVYKVIFGFNGISLRMVKLIAPDDTYYNIKLEWQTDLCLAYETRHYERLAIVPKGSANDLTRSYSADIQVVGNVHQNPDLLEKSK